MNIHVICGGFSPERDISYQSGLACFQAIKNVCKSVDFHFLEKDTDLLLITNDVISRTKEPMFFNSFHGGIGENGSFQGFMDTINIPYTQSGVLASSLAYDKYTMFFFLSSIGINTITTQLYDDILHCNIIYPCVVKPRFGGSSQGLHYITSYNELHNYDSLLKNKEYIIQPYVQGREFTVCVMYRRVLGIIEIIKNDPIFTYSDKYEKSLRYFFNDDIKNMSSTTYQKIIDDSLHVYTRLHCQGIIRCDFMLDEDDIPYMIEVNTHPGMTEKSFVTLQGKRNNLSLSDICMELINTSYFLHKNKRRTYE